MDAQSTSLSSPVPIVRGLRDGLITPYVLHFDREQPLGRRFVPVGQNPSTPFEPCEGMDEAVSPRIHRMWNRPIRWRGKMVTPSRILEQQANGLAGAFLAKETYHPFSFVGKGVGFSILFLERTATASRCLPLILNA